jgi:hypothetical protein
MKFKYLQGGVVALALAMAGCGGEGAADVPPEDGGTGSTPPPQAPQPPPPTPPAPPPAGPVVANAGPDQATVEKQAVLVDGSATRDAENDPITYSWQVVAAPMGSAAKVGATTATFEFTPDVAGTYQLRLTATDPQGSSTDSVQVVADPLLAFVPPAGFNITPQSTAGSERAEIALRTSPHWRGGAVAITPASNAPWLRVTGAAAGGAGQSIGVPVQLDLVELAKLPNGKHTARVTVTPAGGHSAATVDVPVTFVLPHVRTVMPYVAYTGQPARVTLYGDDLSTANGRTLTINGVESAAISAPGNKQATVDLPPLPVGRYTVRIANGLGIVQDMGWLVVRDPPVYADANVGLPGAVEALEFDAERDAFYGVFDNGGDVRAYRLRLASGWVPEPIPVDQPGAVRLSVDGRELLVASGGCSVVHLDPETLGQLRATTKPSCAPNRDELRDVLAFADAGVYAVDEGSQSTEWTYPDFKTVDILPTAERPFALMSYERNGLFWAERPQGQPDWKAYKYSVADSTVRPFTPHGANGFELTNLAISGNGRRVLHRSDLYDEELRYLGTLSGVGDPNGIVPGLNRDGTRSVVLDASADAIVVNDLTAPGFPVAAPPIPLPNDPQDDSVMVVSPNGSTAFAFTTSRVFVFTFHALYVRALPP